MGSFIIVGYLWQVLGRGIFLPSLLLPWAAPKKPTMNRVNNIIFPNKDKKKLMFLLQLYQQDTIKKYQNFWANDLKGQYWDEYKTNSYNENTTNEFRYFLNTNFFGVNRLFVSVYNNHGENAKRFNARKYYLVKGIIKSYNITINGTTFMIKRLIQI